MQPSIVISCGVFLLGESRVQVCASENAAEGADEASQELPQWYVDVNSALVNTYVLLCILALLTIVTRIAAFWYRGLSLTRSHVGFLLLVLLLIVLRLYNAFLSCPSIIKIDQAWVVYDIMNEGPLPIFLAIFMLLIYNVTKVIHSIHLVYVCDANVGGSRIGRDSTLSSFLTNPSSATGIAVSDRVTSASAEGTTVLCCVPSVYCQGMAFLGVFKIWLTVLLVLTWLFMGVALALVATHDYVKIVRISLEVPFIFACLITGFLFIGAGLSLWRRLKHLVSLGRVDAVEDDEASAAARIRFERCCACVRPAVNVSGRATSPRPSTYSDAPGPVAEELLSCLRRILLVVCTCTASFLFRAIVLLYIFQTNLEEWNTIILVLYYAIGEVLPLTMLLILYLLPGIEAFCASRSGLRLSVLEVASIDIPTPSIFPTFPSSPVLAGGEHRRLSGITNPSQGSWGGPHWRRSVG
eukprot:TRINITY_DN13856_c0_g1_i1.p1 TRINITY_DN13856_c0_g1~~TRINITY_DN13856_c0_g1_i1.p1  ORF type:complete len:468 (+),score=50.62 TRINITY_DN13856_c0_g1_i1:131-1534(+)